jgi:hypothetical protein
VKNANTLNLEDQLIDELMKTTQAMSLPGTSKGVTLSTSGLLIAALALENECAVYS